MTQLALLSAAVCSGLLLALAGQWRRGTVALLVWLLPLLVAVFALAPGAGLGALAGLAMGLAFAIPQVLRLRFPPLLAVGLTAYLAAGFTVLGLGVALAARLDGLFAALAMAGVVLLCDRGLVNLVPLWGTAQSWIRPLSRWPVLAAYGGRWGQPLALLALVLAQAVVAAALVGRDPTVVACAVGVVGLLGLGVLVEWAGFHRRRTTRTLRVAAVGWDAERLLASGRTVTFEQLFDQPIATVAAAGARLVVLPETALGFSVAERPALVARFAALAACHRVTVVLGFMDEASQENRAGIFTPDGGLVAEYAKTNLVVAAGEHRMCRPGSGAVVQVEVDGVRVGVLICHDDNFTAPARRHARAGTRLLAVPTNDWAAVKHAHLENVPWRALENRLAIVRGASNGISAVISPDGRIRERMDHTQDGLGWIMCDVPVEG